MNDPLVPIKFYFFEEAAKKLNNFLVTFQTSCLHYFPMVSFIVDSQVNLVRSFVKRFILPHVSYCAYHSVNLQPYFQKGRGLTGPQLLEAVCWEKRGDYFQGGCNFHTKIKLKPEIFNDKESLKAKIFFSVVTKNSNWEILTKNLVTFKRYEA